MYFVRDPLRRRPALTSTSDLVAGCALASAPLGLFGGTFDPVHLGHLRLTEEARTALGLATVRWIPAGQPPLRAAPQTPAAQRLAMVERALTGNPAFEVDAAEVRAEQTSYTVHTLERLRREFGPDRPLVLLLGADAFARLEEWFEWHRLFELAHIGVATRPGHDLAQVGAGETAISSEFRQRCADAAALRTSAAGAIVPFALTPLDISATQIRRLLAGGQSARYLVSEPVLDYIQHNHLYR